MARVGAGLQLSGLAITGLGLVHGLASGDAGAVKTEILLCLAGAAVFGLGVFLAKRGGSWQG